MNIKIESCNGLPKIAKVLNGVSANTLYWLIARPIEQDDKDLVFAEHNTARPDIPYDEDDFSRCYQAYKHFKWNAADIARGVNKAKHYNLKPVLIDFVSNFKELCELYEKKAQRDWLIKMKNIMGNNGFWSSR